MKKITVLLTGIFLGLLLTVPSISLACTQPDGCTPGYWKNHIDSWACFTPDQTFSSVFGVTPSFGDLTLLQVLQQGGGGERAMARHAVAALLNACVADIIEGSGGDFDYCWSVGEVVSAVQERYVTCGTEGNTNYCFNVLGLSFAYDNEKNCPLN